MSTNWQDLEKIAPAEVVTSLKKLNSFYEGRNIAVWMANLYDPEIGGFYYSNSAKEHEGFMPDLESTVQLLCWMEANGAFDKPAREMIPADICDKLIKFAKDMQSDVEGCFYHPQWKNQTVGIARSGRDISWGNKLISMFGGRPDYDVPGGASGILGAPKGKPATEEKVPARRIVADFSSVEAYTKWLEEFNSTIKENSGNAHNMNAMYSEIRGRGFVRPTLDYLDRIQDEVFAEQTAAGEEPTGLWQKPVDYHAVWGLLKFMPFYNDANDGREIRYAKEIVRTCVKVIKLPPEGKYFMNDMMNQWRGIDSMLQNVKKYHPEQLEELYEITRASAKDLVDNSLAKIQDFKRVDGSFSYKKDGHSLSNIYGTEISLGLEEGDVNATGLCSSMYRGVFTCLGYPVVSLCNSDDGAEVIRILTTKGAIEKRPVPKND